MQALDFSANANNKLCMVLDVSAAPDASALRGLLLSCAEHDAQPIGTEPLVSTRELATRERLRGFILESYVRQKPRERLARHAVLTVFVMNGGSARAAALQQAPAGADERAKKAAVRNAQLWAEEFLEFAADKLAEIDEARRRAQLRHDRDYQARALQCSQICGRDHDGGPKGGSGRGCTACPFHAL